MCPLCYLQSALSLAEFFYLLVRFGRIHHLIHITCIYSRPPPPTVQCRHTFKAQAVPWDFLTYFKRPPSDSPQVRTSGQSRWVKPCFFPSYFQIKKSLGHDHFVAANFFSLQLAHFTKKEIGQDKPIYILSLEVKNLVSHSLEPHWIMCYHTGMLYSTLKMGRKL